jgi:hypothetical protein
MHLQDVVQHRCMVDAGEQATGAEGSGRQSRKSTRSRSSKQEEQGQGAGRPSRRSRVRSTLSDRACATALLPLADEGTPPLCLDASSLPVDQGGMRRPPKYGVRMKPCIFQARLPATTAGRL